MCDTVAYEHEIQELDYISPATSRAYIFTGPNGYKAGTSAYAYDANGNMVTDNSKALAITYNLLNLPGVNTLAGGTISYAYDATGRKLRKVSTQGSGSTTDYIDGIQYNGTAIDFIQTDEGRVLNITGTPNYEYSLTDHLGNSRVEFDSNGGAVTKQQDDYMPFGMQIARGTVPSSPNKYLYNNKELQDEIGLGQYDYGARFYDPIIARWMSVDPLAEISRRWSPYGYGENNPIRNIDVDGMSTESFLLENGLSDDDLITLYQAPPQKTDDPQKKKEEQKKVANQTKGIWPTWMYNIPVIGHAGAKSGNELADGQYMASFSDFLYGVGEIWLYAESKAVAASDALMGSFISKQTATEVVSAGVWDDIVATQENYAGTVLPRSFTMSVENGNTVWVHGNATEHIAEYIASVSKKVPPDKVRLITQQLLRSLQSSVNAATENGVIYNRLINIGGWELKFSAPRAVGQLPALIHALPK